MMIHTVLVVALLVATPVSAHDWYPTQCCGGHDCRPVPCTDIEVHADGSATYKPENAQFEKIQNSPDGECHVCTRASPIYKGTVYGYCAYMGGVS
jgi:hypothetical protein